YRLGLRTLYAPPGGEMLFTDNETNGPRVFGPGNASRSTYVKDAFHRQIIDGEPCVNPAGTGTKAAIRYRFDAVPPGESACLRLRLVDERSLDDPLDIDPIIAARRAEADEFYDTLYAKSASEDERRIQRQAWAGLLWTKQSYIFDVASWLDGDNPKTPPPPTREWIRNRHWRHLNSLRVMTVPDKWEYPWFAAWDLAFQCVALASVDPQYAMDQLSVLLFEQFQHANGQIPAYEWEFSDLNPPVHAWAVWRVYNMVRIRTGHADRAFLERCFHKLLTNFTWWVNRVDRRGNNVFEGGFLGLDNVTVFDRSVSPAEGAVLEQSDTTGWMGMFCLNLMRIALELAKENPVYEGMAIKFFEHYTYIAAAMKQMEGGGIPLWNEQDGFFYDVLRHADGHAEPFRVRSLVGLIPLFAVERLESDWIKPFREFTSSLHWFLENRHDLVKDVVHQTERGGELTYVLTIVNNDQLQRLLSYVFDPNEFLSEFGIRSLSRAHLTAPFRFQDRSVDYEPAEAVSKLKGGNSNWRGPIWLPTNFLLIESLRKLGTAYGPDFRVRCPGRPEPGMTFLEMAQEIADRLIALFQRGAAGRRPLHGAEDKFQSDPHWKDLLLFYEYFHGDNGA
ncbi:MAG: MGH1-like glycoside hydrolase domain-containing protein, partial [Pirellulales bacterium]